MKTKALVFLEGPEEVDHAVSYFNNNDFEPIYVSCSSQSCFRLERLGSNYISAHNYPDWGSFHQQTYDHFEVLDKQLHDIDKMLQTEIPELQKYNLTPFELNFFYIKILIDTFQLKIFLIQSVLDAFAEQDSMKTYIYQSKLDIKQKFFSPSDRMNQFVFQLLPDTDYTVLKAEADPKSYYQSSENKLDAKLNRYIFPQRAKNKILKILKRQKFPQDPRLISYATSTFIPEQVLEDRSIKRELLNYSVLKSATQSKIDSEVAEKIKKSQEYKALFINMPKGFSDSLWLWFENNIIGEMRSYLDIAKTVDDKIKDGNPKFFESRTFFHIPSKIIARQFQKHQIPIIGTHHGSLGTQKEKMFYFGGDLKYVTDYCVWAPGVQTYLENYTAQLKSPFNIHITGTNHYAEDSSFNKKNLRKLLKIPSDKKIFLFVGVGFTHNLFYNFGLMFSDQQEYESQTKLIDFFAAQDKTHLIYKGLKSAAMEESHMAQYISKKNSKNITHIQNVSLKKLLPAIDALITDRPATSFLEAMNYQKAIYSYNDKIEFPDDTEQVYKKCASHHRCVEQCIEIISADLRSNKTRETDSTYFNLYGQAPDTNYEYNLGEIIDDLIEQAD